MAAIKMDELLVTWLGSDDVYEKVLNLIETNRSSSGLKSSMNDKDDYTKSLQESKSNNNDNPIDCNDPASSGGMQESTPSGASINSIPSSPMPSPGSKPKTEIPPFYTPNEGGRGRGRKPTPSSDQSWKSVLAKLQSFSMLQDVNPNDQTNVTDNTDPNAMAIVDDGSSPPPPPPPPPPSSTISDVNLNMNRLLPVDQFHKITKNICGFPSFFNGPFYRRILYHAQQQSSSSSSLTDGDDYNSSSPSSPQQQQEEHELQSAFPETITLETFKTFWEQEMEKYDASDRFFRLVKQPDKQYITKDDFLPYIEELLACHPGLEFLSNHAEFQEKYAITVITRIFYSVNTCHNGKITCRQIRKSDLLESFHAVDAEEDINKITRYFSYEHFYVLYCRFWELDHDRDYKITRDDLLKYGEHSLSHMIVDRIFDAAPRPFMSNLTTVPSATALNNSGDSQENPDNDNAEDESPDNDSESNHQVSAITTINNRDYLSYEDFIFFMLSEEDKANEISVRYWFSCIDVDGDGKLNNMEMRSFYAVQLHRMQCLGHDIVPFEDMLCQMIDMIKPKSQDYIVVEDFLQPECCQVSGALFDALFNLNKYLQFEQRDPFMERQKREDEFESDWDRFAYIDYNRLAMEEEAREEEAMEIDWVTVDDDDDDDDGDDFNSLGLGGASEAPF